MAGVALEHGVNANLVFKWKRAKLTFGAEPTKVHPELIEILRTQMETQGDEPAHRFSQGDRVKIKEGPLAGLQAVYQMADGECRAMVLIEILGKLSKLTLEPANLREV